MCSCSFLFTLILAVLRILRIRMSNSRELALFAPNHATLHWSTFTRLANISISNPSQAAISSNNLLAYRPRFNDVHNSNLAGAFINIEGVFPCIQSLPSYYPICQAFSEEEDGFQK